jgi:hypothetical protein
MVENVCGGNAIQLRKAHPRRNRLFNFDKGLRHEAVGLAQRGNLLRSFNLNSHVSQGRVSRRFDGAATLYSPTIASKIALSSSSE